MPEKALTAREGRVKLLAAMEVKQVVILANSWMDGGRCVAGKVLLGDKKPGEWIRLVTNEDGGCLSESQAGEIGLLDVVEAPVLRRAHQCGGHRENQIVDADNIRKVGQFTPESIRWLADNPAMLWMNSSSSGNGQNDRVSGDEFRALSNSLNLISADALAISKHPHAEEFNKKRLRAKFWYRGVVYNLAVTDPRRRQPEKFPTAYLCVSVAGSPNPYDAYHYKLVAGIIAP